MSASVRGGKSAPRISIREAQREDLDCPRLLDDYFRSAAPGIGRELETTAMQRILQRASQACGWSCFLGQAEEDAIGCLLVEDRPWDTDILSVRTKNLTLLVSASDRHLRREIGSDLLRNCLPEQATREREYLVVRIPADDVPLLRALEERGFGVLVPMVTLGKNNTEHVDVVVPAGIEISNVCEPEVKQVQSIAANAFKWGRFSADPGVLPEASQKLHGEWAANCCKGSQAELVLVARRRSQVLGFVALKSSMVREMRVGCIELIAVSETCQGLGIGRALLQTACNWFVEFSEHMVVRTELPNTAAIRLYESQDFKVLNGSLYLSMWRSPVAAE